MRVFFMFNDLAGKRVLVTGASSGIGAALAEAYGQVGAVVTIHYNSNARAAGDLAEALKAKGGQVFLVQGDVGKPDVTRGIVDEAARLMGGLDILVNNAGSLLGRTPFEDITDEDYDKVTDLNIRSVIVASQAAVPHMKAAGGGAIINTSSIAGRNGGGPGAILYAGAKAFVLNVSRGLAKELAVHSIRVNGVAPGVISTPLHESFSTPEILEEARKSIPLARLGQPQDCVGAYLFLSSEAMSGYITGQMIEVNGGQYMP